METWSCFSFLEKEHNFKLAVLSKTNFAPALPMLCLLDWHRQMKYSHKNDCRSIIIILMCGTETVKSYSLSDWTFKEELRFDIMRFIIFIRCRQLKIQKSHKSLFSGCVFSILYPLMSKVHLLKAWPRVLLQLKTKQSVNRKPST